MATPFTPTSQESVAESNPPPKTKKDDFKLPEAKTPLIKCAFDLLNSLITDKNGNPNQQFEVSCYVVSIAHNQDQYCTVSELVDCAGEFFLRAWPSYVRAPPPTGNHDLCQQLFEASDLLSATTQVDEDTYTLS